MNLLTKAVIKAVLINIALFSTFLTAAGQPTGAGASIRGGLSTQNGKTCQYGQLGGLILDRWRELGGPNSPLGCPLTPNEEVGWANSAARLRRFENGEGAWSPWTGPESVVFAWREGDRIKVWWKHTLPFNYDSWIVRWNVNGVYEDQDDVFGQPRSMGQFTYPNAQRHYVTYTFLVEGCDRNQDWPKPPTLCRQGWMQPVSVGPTQAPPPPPGNPTPTPAPPIADLVAVNNWVDLHGAYIHYANEPFTYLFSYCNIGTKATGTFTVMVSVNRGTSTQQSSSYENASLAPGACGQGYWNLSLPAGNHTLEAFLDSSAVIPEANELNNSFYYGIIVYQPYATISPTNGGSLLLSAGGVRLDFPANAVTNPVTVTYTRQDLPSHPLVLGSNALRSFTLEAKAADGQQVTQFLQPYMMVLTYSDADLATLGGNAADLGLVYWDQQRARWIAVPTTVDSTSRSVTAFLDHFTQFALVYTHHLDTFNRPDGTLGERWFGRVDLTDYQIHNQQVDVQSGGVLYWQPEVFGAAQEAFVTLTVIDQRNSRQSVLLKVQGDTPNVRNGAIEVRYYAKTKQVHVLSRSPGDDWQIRAILTIPFVDDDQLGAQALADGTVKVYRNGSLIGTADAGSFFVNRSGRIGLRALDSRNVVLDDMGGGTIATGQ